MYVKQFWKCFEETGNIETYLDLKEYEKLYHEHTQTNTAENNDLINKSELDGMNECENH